MENKDVKRTVAADWRVDGEKDPHGEFFIGPRETISMGLTSNAEISRQLLICYHQMLSIGILTAAKERIRWLSRRIFLSDDKEWIEQLEVERATLPMGDNTDDHLANLVFMNGDDRNYRLATQHLVAGSTRIQWLEKKLLEKGLIEKDVEPDYSLDSINFSDLKK